MATSGVAIKPVTYGACRQFIIDRSKKVERGFADKVDEGQVAIDEDIGRYEVSVGNPVEEHFALQQSTLQIDITNRSHSSRLQLIIKGPSDDGQDTDELKFAAPDGTTRGNSRLNFSVHRTMLDDIEVDPKIEDSFCRGYYAASMRIINQVVSKKEEE